MGNMIKVGMADLKVCTAPNALTTLGLGSCVGVCLYDSATKVAGMLHVMLPDSTQISRESNRTKFADTGIEDMIEQMKALGANVGRMTAKIAGGAQMFAFNASVGDLMRIGDRNVQAVKDKLKALGISIIAEDTGLNYGRTIEFSAETGELLVKSVGKENKVF